jgi:hypothetical protein
MHEELKMAASLKSNHISPEHSKQTAEKFDARTSVMKWLPHLVGFLLIGAGSLTVLTLGFFLFYGSDSSQQSAVVALTSCLCWFLAYSTYQCIGLFTRLEKINERNVHHWTFTPRNLSLVMTIVTALIFGVLVLRSFDLTLPFLIVAPFVLFFPFTYMAYSAFQRPVRIKRLRGDFELLTAQWDEPLYQQSTSFFNYALHITLAILATLLGLFILFSPVSNIVQVSTPSSIPTPGFDLSLIGIKLEVLRAMGFGFLGGFLFSMYYVYRRYTTSDLLPPVYLYCAITMILGLVFNYIAFGAIDSISSSVAPQGVIKGMVDLLAFAIGFFPILAVQWLTQTVYKAFGQPQRRSDLFPLDQLDGISQSQEIRLRDYGIDDAQNLASTEMPLLLINTPFPVQTVVDWVDQAVLMVLLNDINALDNFRKAHVRTMTDFRDLWEPVLEKYDGLKRARDIAAKNAASNDIAVKSEVEDLTKRLDEVKDEQTQIATALNSNVSLLNALYSSTNFDMNIHYLNNYRKNIELLLPSWTSARFNRYLIEAYNACANKAGGKELTRLWKSAHEYLESNKQIEEALIANPEDESVGVIVNPTSIEARLGLAALYTHHLNECTDKEKAEYLEWIDAEYKEAIGQILAVSNIVINIKSASKDKNANDTAGWALLQDAASQALKPNSRPGGASSDQTTSMSSNGENKNGGSSDWQADDAHEKTSESECKDEGAEPAKSEKVGEEQ